MKSKLLFALVLISTSVITMAAPPEDEGKLIFSSRCAACHNVNKALTGPALAGVDQRRTMEWIVNFVQSSQTMIKSGDKEALALFEKYNRIPMPDHRDLTETDVKNIVSFIKASAVSADASAAPFSKPSKLRPAYVPVSFTANMTFFVAFFAAVVLLIAALLLWVRVKEIERSANGNQSL
jgi:cytochrome c551/c552